MSKNSLETITLNKPGITDFALARNLLLKQSKADWVFFLDSDETMSVDLKKEISHKIYNSKYSAYYVFRKNYFLGQYVGVDKIIRLMKKGSGKWKRSVHEVFYPHLLGVGVGELTKPLIHNTTNNLHTYISKINRYSELHAVANQIERKRSSLLKIIFCPIGKFFVTLLKSKNVVFSIMQSFHSFLSWSKEWILQNA